MDASLLVGVAVGLGSAVVGATAQHLLGLRADRVRRERDRAEKRRDRFAVEPASTPPHLQAVYAEHLNAQRRPTASTAREAAAEDERNLRRVLRRLLESKSAWGLVWWMLFGVRREDKRLLDRALELVNQLPPEELRAYLLAVMTSADDEPGR